MCVFISLYFAHLALRVVPARFAVAHARWMNEKLQGWQMTVVY